MKVQVIIERGVDGTFDANMEFNENIPFGLLGQGKTVAETVSDFNNSYAEIKAMYANEGKDCAVLEFDFR
jgi:hypothetical protein